MQEWKGQILGTTDSGETKFIKTTSDGSLKVSPPDIDYGIYYSTDYGVATGGSDTTIVNTIKDYEVDILKDKLIKFLVNGIQYIRKIVSNTKDTITFATIGASSAATAILGSHDAGEVTIITEEESASANDYSVEIVEGVENGDLSASLTDNMLTITLGMGIGDKATATIGSGENGAVLIEVDEAGATGNEYTVTINTTETEDANLSVMLNVTDINIVLGNDLTEVSTTKNTATLIAQAINLIEGFTATASGTGADSITETMEQTNFSGGGLNPVVDNAKNTATAIAEAVDVLDEFSATMTGAGGVLTVTDEPIQFTGGVDAIPVVDGTDYYII